MDESDYSVNDSTSSLLSATHPCLDLCIEKISTIDTLIDSILETLQNCPYIPLETTLMDFGIYVAVLPKNVDRKLNIIHLVRSALGTHFTTLNEHVTHILIGPQFVIDMAYVKYSF